jgi:hypothetical protein
MFYLLITISGKQCVIGVVLIENGIVMVPHLIWNVTQMNMVLFYNRFKSNVIIKYNASN